MAHETMVKRILYVAKCVTCGDKREVLDNPPKQWYCANCNQWVDYVETTYTGPSVIGE